MRTVVSNSEAAHFWANQTQEYVNRGRTGGSLSFHGRLVYSYSTVMGVILDAKDGSKVYLLNCARYSNTTSKHQSYIWHACPSYRQKFSFKITPDTNIPRNFARIRELLVAQLESIPGLNKDGKSGVRREKKLAEFVSSVNYANEFAVAVTGKPVFNDLMAPDAMAKLQKAARKLEKAKEKARIEQDKKYEALQQERLAKWLAGDPNIESWFNFAYARLRLSSDGTEVQTTQGARVPVEHVQKALPLVLSLINNGRTYKRNGHTIHLGHYAIDEITKDGTLIAGCHKFTKAEILRFATLLPKLTAV